ncbi:MAG: hypothetical protein G01um101448_1229 [Parcubacteria group bacterium Gr01-1014_48]|nr:MAG: hypothetical protein G01um101448_1229 [Parcubacteria group bacterium Gr01-1014_48]
MKNLQKGFIVPALLVIIALLVIGGGVYVYENKKSETPVPSTTDTQNPPVTTQQIPPPANTNPVKSSITIMSPNGQEVWADGSSQTIRWTSKGSDATQPVEIDLLRKTSADTQFWNIGTIATNQSGSGSYTWKVSAKDTTGKITAGSQYKILIGRNLAKGTGPVDESNNYFTITNNQTVSGSGNTSTTSGLYGKITKTTGNCMPQTVDPNHPGSTGPNPCKRAPLSTEVYVYPPLTDSSYIEPLTTSGASRYEYFGVIPILDTALYTAPLRVNFSTSLHTGGTIVFGDGEQVTCAATGSYSGPCNDGIQHTFVRPGTFVAKLQDVTGETLQQVRIKVLDGGIVPIARTVSDSAGNYTVAISLGSYSVFVKDNGSPYCNLFRDSISCPVEVGSGGRTLYDININAASW